MLFTLNRSSTGSGPGSAIQKAMREFCDCGQLTPTLQAFERVRNIAGQFVYPFGMNSFVLICFCTHVHFFSVCLEVAHPCCSVCCVKESMLMVASHFITSLNQKLLLNLTLNGVICSGLLTKN